MGQRKKIDRFNDDLDVDEGTTREAEDDASRRRIAGYEKIKDRQVRNDAVEGERLWRESIGLPEISYAEGKRPDAGL